ncbi:DUF3857 domain-containing protein [Kordia sp. YSTF-M3]|uniref:DUF3857 domain-containing protein n=1 Tax=Kordia aestuariivivens TaxID=2759037 RepID=A0ABR7QCA6_9FLAO|nr:DUF3857 domain-containing protein [Kordia aestuariivivens]MBC8756185.1 DUF3857 domain-containing protein [Kordia aestuariivivens]
MKYFQLLLFCLFSASCFGQNPFEERFNKVSEEELNMQVYRKDSTAPAVVLYENAKKTFEYIEENEDTYTKLHYYAKIKILSIAGLEEGNIIIPFIKSKFSEEEIVNIKAITHNLDGSSTLQEDQIIRINVKDDYNELKLLLPNVKVGSVIEYQYTLISPFTFSFRPWFFQSNIPKVYSEFNAKIPANYRFLRSFKGNLKLTVNGAYVIENCFEVPDSDKAVDCEIVRYAVKDVPAFRKEQFSLSYENYISRIEFKLAHYRSFGFSGYGQLKTWEEFDRSINSNKQYIRRILKKSMLKDFLPKEILKTKQKLEKAKKVYQFIRDHFVWNTKIGGLDENDIRKAFQRKEGSISEINLSLMNAMHAAGIRAEVLLIATRDHSIPTQDYPVMSDFNYLIVKVIIKGKVYFLDASEKAAPFGILPMLALNYKGRALNFNKKSYWETITPNLVNRLTTSISLTLEEDGTIKGKFANALTGHFALSKRNTFDKEKNEEYLNTIETEYEGLEILDYKITDKENAELPLKEFFEFEIDKEPANNTLYLDPFVFKAFPKNPFTLKKRTYPVDFAHPRIYTTRFLLSLPPNYEFGNLPKNQTFTIGENKAICKLTTVQQNGKLNITFELLINQFHYTTEEYELLKNFFTNLVKIQKNTLLTIKKKNS